MTRSHSKTNTTQSSLTYYERSLLRQETAAKRLGGDSFKKLDHCYLCLSKLSSPVACPHGHVFCRECAISNLITQKAGIESAKRDLEAWAAKEEREKEDARLRARERVISDFEKGMGLGVGVKRAQIKDAGYGPGGVGGAIGEKKGEMERLAGEAEEKALKAIEREQAEARKTKLVAFWVPNMAPDGRTGPIKDVKLETLCPATSDPHPFSRKTLLPVVLTYPTPSATTPSCPSCSKELNNATDPILLSSRKPLVVNGDAAKADDGAEPPAKKKKKSKKEEAPYVCGHVVCKTCADTIVKPSGRCCVCEAEVDDAGRIPMGKEGTGFAAAGGAEVKKNGISFRV